VAIFAADSVSLAPFTLDGIGLRSGRPARVVLRARPGPFALSADGVEVALAEVSVEETDRATVVRAGDVRIATVEHLLAACAALGMYDGVVVAVFGGEVPLVDGASRAFLHALRMLAVPPAPAPLVVLRDETLTHGESRYAFRRSSGTHVGVSLAYDDPRISADASWAGDPDDFSVRIASARTFAFAHEVDALVRAGHASHVDPASVVVFAPDAVLASGEPFASDEPARHKLLDLMGDLFIYGGPPRGSVHVFRPGHRATHAVLREALRRGIVAR
jgi:UDP-3-O-[3-hydroxymyristoyl] N-acetylglucosamine deacetylase